mgnify:CR=1 FL=1
MVKKDFLKDKTLMIADSTDSFASVILKRFLYPNRQEIRIIYKMRKSRVTYAIIYRQSTQSWLEREKFILEVSGIAILRRER